MPDQPSTHFDYAVREDFCDDCGRPMPMTGDSLCLVCHEAEEARWTCIVCGGFKVWADQPCCSDACDAEYERWPEP